MELAIAVAVALIALLLGLAGGFALGYQRRKPHVEEITQQAQAEAVQKLAEARYAHIQAYTKPKK